jgi:hypothetical protein
VARTEERRIPPRTVSQSRPSLVDNRLHPGVVLSDEKEEGQKAAPSHHLQLSLFGGALSRLQTEPLAWEEPTNGPTEPPERDPGVIRPSFGTYELWKPGGVPAYLRFPRQFSVKMKPTTSRR